jgi:hypothetical protein
MQVLLSQVPTVLWHIVLFLPFSITHQVGVRPVAACRSAGQQVSYKKLEIELWGSSLSELVARRCSSPFQLEIVSGSSHFALRTFRLFMFYYVSCYDRSNWTYVDWTLSTIEMIYRCLHSVLSLQSLQSIPNNKGRKVSVVGSSGWFVRHVSYRMTFSSDLLFICR